MNEETARYLARYLKQYEDDFMTSPSSILVYPQIDVEALAQTIHNFFQELP